jgi:hypothetical protein
MKFQTVTPPLPIEHFVTCAGRFAFGVPWPWDELDVRGSLVNSTGADLDVETLVHVWAPRTDGIRASFLSWQEPHRPDIERGLGQTSAQMTSLYRGRLAGTTRIFLAGSRAALIEIETSEEHITRLVSYWSDSSLQGEFRVPRHQWEAYSMQFQTMLGSWSWN